MIFLIFSSNFNIFAKTDRIDKYQTKEFLLNSLLNIRILLKKVLLKIFSQ
jgi:membrane protein CcdC involved in cytochrome C biogenesis